MQTFTGKQYLKIDIASNFGLDKKSWQERINWFDANEHQLLSLVPQAETPALYYAGVQAWNQVKKGEAIGYPISLDATSSGFQLLAALTGDRKAASICNVINTGSRMDAYTTVYERMLEEIGEEGKIQRKDTKQAIMTSLYSSEAVPKKIFGEGILLAIFYATMKEMAPIAWELNKAFLHMWNSEALSNDWVMPDNFHVHIKVMKRVTGTVHFLNEPFEVHRTINAPIEGGRSLGANSIHSLDAMVVREMTRRCMYDPMVIERCKKVLNDEEIYYASDKDCELAQILWDHYKASGYLSARILDCIAGNTIDYMDRDVIWDLINSLPKKPFQIMSIHDCFRCLPQYANDLRWQYNNQLMLIAKSDLLSYLVSQILGRVVKIQKGDENLWKDIMETDYALS